MATSAETLSAIGRFIRDTSGAPTLAEAASIRGMTLEHAAAEINAAPAPKPAPGWYAFCAEGRDRGLTGMQLICERLTRLEGIVRDHEIQQAIGHFRTQNGDS